MKLVFKQEIEIKDPSFQIALNPVDGWKPRISVSWTCPDCAGHGCNRHNMNNRDCNGGGISKTLLIEDLKDLLSPESLQVLRGVISEMQEKIK